MDAMVFLNQVFALMSVPITVFAFIGTLLVGKLIQRPDGSAPWWLAFLPFILAFAGGIGSYFTTNAAILPTLYWWQVWIGCGKVSVMNGCIEWAMWTYVAKKRFDKLGSDGQ
jgi:hypothetical protein